MKPEDIDNMQAGRELDMLVAQYVMGWTRILSATKLTGWQGADWIGGPTDGQLARLPYFSVEIHAAWLVVEKTRLFTHCDITQVIGAWVILNHANDSQVTADTAPLAICRAALKAITSKPNTQPLIDSVVRFLNAPDPPLPLGPPSRPGIEMSEPIVYEQQQKDGPFEECSECEGVFSAALFEGTICPDCI